MNKEKKYRANFTNSKVQHESSEYLSINGRKDGRPVSCGILHTQHNHGHYKCSGSHQFIVIFVPITGAVMMVFVL